MAEERAIGGLPNSPIETMTRGKNHFFAIGISTYQHFPRLTNARKDIEDIAKILVEQYSFNQEDVQLILDDNANRRNILDQLDALRNTILPGDRLLIYYSGHGYSDDSRGFWIPVDAEREHVSSFISNADILEIIKYIKARHILLISDSCFSGSLLYRDVSASISKKAIETWDRDPSRYAFVSGKGPVSDGIAGENSPFADGIIRQLRNNEEDAINIVSLADQVTKEIRYTYDQQAEVNPLQGAGHKGGQYIFFKKGKENLVYASVAKEDVQPGKTDTPTIKEEQKPISPGQFSKTEDGKGNVTYQSGDKIYNINEIKEGNFS